MRFFLVRLPDGRTVQVQASSVEQAVTLTRNAYRGQMGATDLQNIGVMDMQGSAQPYAPTTPALNFKVQDYQQGPTANTDTGQIGPGYNPDPGGAASPGGGAIRRAIAPNAENEFPEAAYLEAQTGAGRNPYGTFGSFIRQQRPLYEALAGVGGRLGTVNLPQGGEGTTPYTGFVGGTGAGQLGRLSQNTFAELMRRATAPNVAQDDPSFNSYFNPDFTSGGDAAQIGESIALARGAAGQQYSPFLARNFLPSNDRLINDYQRTLLNAPDLGGTGQQQQSGDWLSFLKRRLGLQF